MRVFVILMLLLNLGLTLGADIFTTDKHAGSDIEAVHVAQGLHSVGSARDSKDFAGQDCFDPCHAGGSHFGHCSIVFKSLASTAYPHVSKQLLGVPSEDGLKEVYLEGHRRPPKNS